MSRDVKVGLMLWIVLVLACSMGGCDGSSPINEAFNPTSAKTLEPGEYSYSELNIPRDVTVSLAGDVAIQVEGAVNIEGTLTGDCIQIHIETSDNLTLDGLISNACTNEDAIGREIELLAQGDIVLGSIPSDDPVIIAGGDVLISFPGGEDIDIKPVYPEESSSAALSSNVPHIAAPVFVDESTTMINRHIQAEGDGDIRILNDGATIKINASLTAGDGTHGSLHEGPTCDARLDEGGRGGSIYIIALEGNIEVGEAVTLHAGDGGDGGVCTASDGCPSTARSGSGGLGGDIFLAAKSITFSEYVVLEPGNGGHGGWARARGKDGEEDCKDGCMAEAEGGDGGYGGYIGTTVYVDERRISAESILGIPTVTNGNGGHGGWTLAIGGHGANCSSCPAGLGGEGGDARSWGGDGGHVQSQLEDSLWYDNAPETWQGGDGGEAIANSGNGGDGATCCNPPQEGGIGGSGGTGRATGGKPGRGYEGLDGKRGASKFDSIGDGGDGGDGEPRGYLGGRGMWWDPEQENLRRYGLDGYDGGLCKQPASFIAEFWASYKHFSGFSKILYQAILLAADPEPLPNAVVDITMIRPDGTSETMSITTNPDGIASGEFEIYIYGDYTLTIDKVTAEGIAYNPVLNIASSISLNVTATEAYPVFGTERIEAFFEAFNAAFEAQDPTFLSESLHPAAIERYGATCPSYLESIKTNPVVVEVLEVTAFGPWVWESDGRATSVDNAYSILVNYSVEGQTSQMEIHLALREDASLGFFPDCGEPIP